MRYARKHPFTACVVVNIDKHYCLVTLANNDEALSITKESLIKLLSLIGCE